MLKRSTKSTVEVETYELEQKDVEKLLLAGFSHEVFLDGRPGSAQRVELDLDNGQIVRATIRLITEISE